MPTVTEVMGDGSYNLVEKDGLPLSTKGKYKVSGLTAAGGSPSAAEALGESLSLIHI